MLCEETLQLIEFAFVKNKEEYPIRLLTDSSGLQCDK